MADYSRSASGYRYKFAGLKTNAPPDAVGDQKYPLATNVRATDDTTLQTRPGMTELFTSPFSLPITDIRAYSALGTDNLPRILARDSQDNIILDTGLSPGSLLGGGASPGVAMIPFRPNQSPEPYMYIANGTDYRKFSAPSAANSVDEFNVGIVEPQTPPEAGISNQYQSLFQGEPAGFNYTAGGTAAGLLTGSRITDQVIAVFPDRAGQGINTLQVTGGFGSLPTAIYLYSAVRAYFFPANHAWNGGFGYPFPLDTSTALTARQGNSLRFNPVEFNGTLDPNVQPMEWAVIDANGNITSYNIASTFATEQYDMAVLCQIFVPVAGNYTIKINHDDGMIFAIAGASLVSGGFTDLFNHVRTAVQGLTFTNTTLGGNNSSGFSQETFVVNFPAPGVYAMEIDYAQWVNEQSLNVFRGDGSNITSGGVQSYQREMSILIGGQVQEVQDVFPPLPQAIGISGIYYLTGPPGRCVIVPASLSPGSGNAGVSLYDQAVLAGLRRGSLVDIGGEVCLFEFVSTGPNGTVCFETTTTLTHTAAEMLNGVPAISILGAATAGQAITSPDITFTVHTGIGTINNPVAGANPFVNGTSSFQEEDYIHVSVNVDDLAALTEMKILFDVGDGSFTGDFYYYTIRPSDIAAGVQNTLTQLGVAQIVAQRRVIDEERAAAAGNQAITFSSAQTDPGAAQWSEIFFPISELTRVGNAQSKSLVNANAIQFLFNVTGTVNFALNSFSVLGGFAPDVGDSGIPYQYRIRPRSTITGVKGNPSPATRYGLSPRRQQVTVKVPGSYFTDIQADVWDVFRFGGSLTSWRFIGYVPIGFSTTTFIDNFGDDAAEAGAELELDNLEPWPTVDLPLNAIATQVNGTAALVTIPSPTNVLRLLPGNLVQLGGANVYHLWTRPTLLSGTTYLFRFLENAGASLNTSLTVTEPLIAKQHLPYMWGPDAEGTVFAVGDPLRPGNVSFAKNYAPDTAPDSFNIEITPPSEPMLGGEVLDGVSYAASTERWWRLYAQGTAFLNPQVRTQHYSAVQQAIPRGLAAPYGHCTDGSAIFWWAKDGIWDTAHGSLTDADLYNLFPHEGVPGVPVIYNGVVIQPPDYSRAGTFRLAYGNGYLYATYQDLGGAPRRLTLDIKRMAWCVDTSPNDEVTVVYHVEQQEGSVEVPAGASYPQLLLGTQSGIVAEQTDRTNDLSAPIACAVATMEWDAGDTRAAQQWGDGFLDNISSAIPSGITAQPMSGGQPIGTATVIPPTGSRVPSVISLGGGVLTRFMGLLTTWTDDFSMQSSPSQLIVFQFAYIPKPETIGDRDSDWMNVQPDGKAGWVQGFLLHADSFNAVKGLSIQDSDTLAIHPFTTAVQHNGESIKAYSFNVPFIAHQIRIVPTDLVAWRLFDWTPVSEATPEVAETWETQSTSFGFNGYSHMQRIVAAYASQAPVTLTITAYDGTSPAPITFPSTSGAYQKSLQVLTFNKGQLFHFRMTSPLPFQAYMDDWEIICGEWNREGSYTTYKSLGGKRGDAARI